jgi:hypothetical protein
LINQELLELEKKSQLFEYRDKYNVPIWLYIRNSIFWEKGKSALNLDEPHLANKVSLFEIVRYLLYTIKLNAYRTKKNRILIFGAGINNVMEKGIYINKLYDLYIMDNKEFQLLESSSKLEYKMPRFNKDVLYSDIFHVLAALFKKFVRISKKEKQQIDNLVEYLLELKLICKDTNKWEKILLNINKSNKIKYILFSDFLRRKKPKALIIEDAHYGGYSILIKIAKSMHIPIIEMQHGFINEAHYAYNYNEALYNQIAAVLPDYFLSFGNYWNSKISTPSKCIPVGNAYLENKKLCSEVQKRILIVSSGTLPNAYKELLISLKNELSKEYEIIFRPHPSERPGVKCRYSELEKLGLELDYENLYDRLRTIDIVVSLEMTTVLFEALAYTNRVFLIKSNASIPYIKGDEPFIIVDDYQKLVHSIKMGEFVSNCNIDNIWQPNAIDSFNVFIKSLKL